MGLILQVCLVAGCGAMVDENSFGDVGARAPDAFSDGAGFDAGIDGEGGDGTDGLGGDGESDVDSDEFGDSEPDDGMDSDAADDVSEVDVECIPACDGKQCGPDGCGGVCGFCPGPPGCGDVKFSPSVQKVTELAPGNGGTPGEALDVDGNPATCSPAPGCQDGLDNQVADLLSQASAMFPVENLLGFSSALESGQLVLLMEMVDPTEDGKPFTVNLYAGSTVEPKDACDFQEAECAYKVDATSVDPETCVPLTSLTNAKIENGKLKAGGGPFTFYFTVEVVPGTTLSVPVSLVQLKGDVVSEGGKIHIENGVLGGAVLKDMLVESLASLVVAASLGNILPEDVIIQLLDNMFTADMDVNGDGSADAASLGLKFRTIPGLIVGLDVADGPECSPDGQCTLP